MMFDGCRFDRVAWANCKFDESTKFNRCQFAGGIPPVLCDGFGSVQLTDCSLDPDAEAIRNNVLVKEGRRNYSVDDLRTDMQCVIKKFVGGGDCVLRRVDKGNLTKGTIGFSRYRDEIINVLATLVIEEHPTPGTSVKYHVRKNAESAVRFYATNNNFTGTIADAFDRLKKDLALK